MVLATALGISVAAVAVHGSLRTPDDLFTDELEVRALLTPDQGSLGPTMSASGNRWRARQGGRYDPNFPYDLSLGRAHGARLRPLSIYYTLRGQWSHVTRAPLHGVLLGPLRPWRCPHQVAASAAVAAVSCPEGASMTSSACPAARCWGRPQEGGVFTLWQWTHPCWLCLQPNALPVIVDMRRVVVDMRHAGPAGP